MDSTTHPDFDANGIDSSTNIILLIYLLEVKRTARTRGKLIATKSEKIKNKKPKISMC